MKILSSFAFVVLAISAASCQSPSAPSNASEAVYAAPDRIIIQRDVQQLHDDIQRQKKF